MLSTAGFDSTGVALLTTSWLSCTCSCNGAAPLSQGLGCHAAMLSAPAACPPGSNLDAEHAVRAVTSIDATLPGSVPCSPDSDLDAVPAVRAVPAVEQVLPGFRPGEPGLGVVAGLVCVALEGCGELEKGRAGVGGEMLF